MSDMEQSLFRQCNEWTKDDPQVLTQGIELVDKVIP